MKYANNDSIEYFYMNTKHKYECLIWIVSKSFITCYDLVNVKVFFSISIN